MMSEILYQPFGSKHSVGKGKGIGPEPHCQKSTAQI